MALNISNEIDRATSFGQKMEELVVNRGTCPSGPRDTLLIGYWALLFDYHKGILNSLSSSFYGSAFALVRPVMEALVRSHFVLMCSEEDLVKIQQDEYRVNLVDVAPKIDAAFGLDGFFTNFFDGARTALHSYTHAGILQIGRRFEGSDMKPNYSDVEIVEVIRTTTSAVSMATSLVTKKFQFEDEWKANNELLAEWGRQNNLAENRLPASTP